MTPTFLGQSVLGSAASITATPFSGTAAQEDTFLNLTPGTTQYGPAPAVAVTGVLTGASSGAVTTAQQALTALAGAVGPLVVPTGRSAVPGAGTPATLTAAAAATTVSAATMPPGSSPVYTAPTQLTVSSVAGLAAGSMILVQSATGTNADVATIASIASLTITLATPLHHGYAAGDLVTPIGPLSPVQTLEPGGTAASLPGGATYPGWDTYTAHFAAGDVVFGATTGTGPYQCTYSAIFRRVPGAGA